MENVIKFLVQSSQGSQSSLLPSVFRVQILIFQARFKIKKNGIEGIQKIYDDIILNKTSYVDRTKFCDIFYSNKWLKIEQ